MKASRKLERLAAYHGVPVDRNGFNLLRCRNKYSGRRAFIVGNGPSLTIPDLDQIKGEVCFASNKIYLAFDETRWRPDCIFMEDSEVIKHTRNRLSDLGGVPLMLPHTVRMDYSPLMNYHYHWQKLAPPLRPDFGTDPMTGFYWGFTITYTILQWAWYCGIREVYLIGIDFHYPLATPETIREQGLTKYYESSGESTHFHKDYYPKGTTWMVPDLAYQGKAFESARDYYYRNGGMVYNATRGGKLEVFERVDFDGLFNR